MPKFVKLRVSLAPITMLPIEKAANYEGAGINRRGYLNWAFGEERQFLSPKGTEPISFVPIEAEEGFVAGFFAKECDISARKKENSAFPKVQHENWELALFVMNIAEDSQIAWVQNGTKVGTPKSILEAFLTRLPKTRLGQFTPSVGYLDSEHSYWAAVDKYERSITQISFTFFPPNVLSIEDKVNDFLRLAQKQGRPKRQKHIYSADAGEMNAKSEIMQASAKVAIEGAGKAEIRAGGRKVWSSSKARTIKEVEDEIMPTVEKPDFIKRIISKLFNNAL